MMSLVMYMSAQLYELIDSIYRGQVPSSGSFEALTPVSNACTRLWNVLTSPQSAITTRVRRTICVIVALICISDVDFTEIRYW
jgi:hypothetical protein